MGLQVYRSKRKFDVTSEPRGRTARSKGHQFVIQKHAARRLHYDLRLELDGVMKSWAVTKGPSLVPGEKRLAVEVEDHPIEYNTFEGTIPEGEYGGGTVLIWDRGAWIADGDPHASLKKGHLDFALEGKKLHGRFHLVRMRDRPGDRKHNWLLIKANDEWVRSPKDPDILEEMPQSAVTGRTIDDIAQGKGKTRVWHSNRSAKANVKTGATRAANGGSPPHKRARSPHSVASARKTGASKTGRRKKSAKSHGSPLPDFVPPSLATLRAVAPSGGGWVHEIKFDGYRIEARLDGDEVRLLTRKGLDWKDKFPNVAAAVAELPADSALIDGEIVVEDEKGVANFSMLQAALKEKQTDRFIYYVFDALHIDGRDLRALPLIERKRELKRLVDRAGSANQVIRYSEHFEEDGTVVLQQACRMSLEGIVSKRADASYRPGRSEDFVKIKCVNAQEFVVGGYSPSTAMPRAIGALAVGYFENGGFIYAGRIGTGYTQVVARDLFNRLKPLEIARPAFANLPADLRGRRDIRWVEPKLVVEAQFRGWTADTLLRQAAFKGLREDKPAREVVHERPADVEPDKQPVRASKIAAEATKPMARKSKSQPRASKRRQDPVRKPKSGEAAEVRFTHPDRVYWADVSVTKKDLADYYRLVWDWMAPHVVNRPLSLVRCPEGTKGECFFQKHASAGMDDKYLRAVVDSKKRQVVAIEDLSGMLSLVQAGVLEVHVRGSMIDRLDLCDRIVFDLDPGEDIGWSDIVAAARDVRERLEAIDLESFVKLSGGKGLHVVVPIVGADWETTKTFVQAFAQAMAADNPDRYVANMAKKLRKGKIFIDYLRNSLEQTSVAAFSSRARDGAPVSATVSWDELARVKAANQYTVLNIKQRLGRLKQDPWKGIGRLKQKLPDLRALTRRK